jgi:hypothetical protein
MQTQREIGTNNHEKKKEEEAEDNFSGIFVSRTISRTGTVTIRLPSEEIEERFPFPQTHVERKFHNRRRTRRSRNQPNLGYERIRIRHLQNAREGRIHACRLCL